MLNNNFKRILFKFLYCLMQLYLIAIYCMILGFIFPNVYVNPQFYHGILAFGGFILIFYLTDYSDKFLYNFCKLKQCDNCNKCMMWSCKDYQKYLKKKEGKNNEKVNN